MEPPLRLPPPASDVAPAEAPVERSAVAPVRAPGALAPAASDLRLMRWAVAFGVVAFVVVVGWTLYEALQRPDVGASFYGKGRFFTGSYWGPFLAFCVSGLGFVVYIFYRALQRLRHGDLTVRLRGPRA